MRQQPQSYFISRDRLNLDGIEWVVGRREVNMGEKAPGLPNTICYNTPVVRNFREEFSGEKLRVGRFGWDTENLVAVTFPESC